MRLTETEKSKAFLILEIIEYVPNAVAVSYTHLDVYKRQTFIHGKNAFSIGKYLLNGMF